MSLQTTLDRLGFTVNVPRDYQGRRLANWGRGRVSTRSDETPSGWFEAKGQVQFTEVSRQSDLGRVTTFAAETTAGEEMPLFGRVDSMEESQRPLSQNGPRFESCVGCGSSHAGRTATYEIHGTVRFSIDFTSHSFGHGPLFSTSADNPGGASQLLVLPARRGGAWVDEGENTGHWEGGVDDDACLLCWEDTVHGDNDFQDLVIDAEGIRPAHG